MFPVAISPAVQKRLTGLVKKHVFGAEANHGQRERYLPMVYTDALVMQSESSFRKMMSEHALLQHALSTSMSPLNPQTLLFPSLLV